MHKNQIKAGKRISMMNQINLIINIQVSRSMIQAQNINIHNRSINSMKTRL